MNYLPNENQGFMDCLNIVHGVRARIEADDGGRGYYVEWGPDDDDWYSAGRRGWFVPLHTGDGRFTVSLREGASAHEWRSLWTAYFILSAVRNSLPSEVIT